MGLVASFFIPALHGANPGGRNPAGIGRRHCRGGDGLCRFTAGEMAFRAAAGETAGGNADCFRRIGRASARPGNSLRRPVLPENRHGCAAGADGGTGGPWLLGRAGAAVAVFAGNRRRKIQARGRGLSGGGERGGAAAARGDGAGRREIHGSHRRLHRLAGGFVYPDHQLADRRVLRGRHGIAAATGMVGAAVFRAVHCSGGGAVDFCRPRADDLVSTPHGFTGAAVAPVRKIRTPGRLSPLGAGDR